MKHFSLYFIVLALVMTAICSCSRTPSWKIKGSVTGGENSIMTVETAAHGIWMPIDTIKIGGDGAFEFSRTAGKHPDIYRISLNGKHIYIPIDSIESLSLHSDAKSFDTNYTLAGSTAADIITKVDRKLMKSAESKGVTATVNDSVLKRELAQLLLQEPSGIVAYYIINKRIGGIPVFDPENRADLRVIGAVANAYDRERPEDPRTEYLKTLFLTHRASMPFPVDTIVAGSMSFPELVLYDYAGRKHDLHQTARKHKVVLLNFTAYTASESPAFNIELNKIYQQFHNKGLEIYQVAIDEDEFQWKQSAKNLSWIAVYNPPTDAQNLLNFNIRALPTTFIIANGELVERADQVTTLQNKLTRYLQ